MVWPTSCIAFVKNLKSVLSIMTRGIDVSIWWSWMQQCKHWTVPRLCVSCLQCIKNRLNRKKYNISKLIHRTVYISISKTIDIKVQCAVITKYYFSPKQIASSRASWNFKGIMVKYATNVRTDNIWYVAKHMYVICASSTSWTYVSTLCKSKRSDSVFWPSQNGPVFLTV